MNLFKELNISRIVLQAVLFKKRFPFGVGWNITHRCNLKCSYCRVWPNRTEEMDTPSALGLIEQLAAAGARFITFSGGEPLLRDDLGQIIAVCKQNGMQVGINTNGALVRSKFENIREVDEVQVSLDGPAQVNDPVRGRGVHDAAVEAIRILRDHGIPVNISAVVTGRNFNSIPYLLDLADRYDSGLYIHPADTHLSGRTGKTLGESPTEAEFKKVIAYLVEEKKKGRRSIYNTLSGLKHLSHWPKPTKIFCLARLLLCNIEPDGRVVSCDMCPNYQDYLLPIGDDFMETFRRLTLPDPCLECWCGSVVEFNMAGALKPDSMLAMWTRFRKGRRR